MAMNNKYKLGDVAKDLNVPTKELVDLLSSADNEKKRTTALSAEELNTVFETYTKKNSVENFDAYFASAKQMEEPKKAEQPEKKVEKKVEAAKEVKETPKQSKAQGEKVQTEKAQNERPQRQDRPQGERKPQGDRPQGERKPYGDRPQGERKPYGDRPQNDRFQNQQKPQQPKPAKPAPSRPVFLRLKFRSRCRWKWEDIWGILLQTFADPWDRCSGKVPPG